MPEAPLASLGTDLSPFWARVGLRWAFLCVGPRAWNRTSGAPPLRRLQLADEQGQAPARRRPRTGTYGTGTPATSQIRLKTKPHLKSEQTPSCCKAACSATAQPTHRSCKNQGDREGLALRDDCPSEPSEGHFGSRPVPGALERPPPELQANLPVFFLKLIKD